MCVTNSSSAKWRIPRFGIRRNDIRRSDIWRTDQGTYISGVFTIEINDIIRSGITATLDCSESELFRQYVN